MTEYQQSSEDAGTKVDAVVRVTRPLKVGINLSATEGSMAGKTPRWADLLAIASRAEALGFDSLWCPITCSSHGGSRSRVPFMPIGREKAQLLERLKQLAQQLEQLDLVEQVTVFHAIAMAPPSGDVKHHRDAIH